MMIMRHTSIYEQSRQDSLLNLQITCKIYEMFTAQVENTILKMFWGHIKNDWF